MPAFADVLSQCSMRHCRLWLSSVNTLEHNPCSLYNLLVVAFEALDISIPDSEHSPLLVLLMCVPTIYVYECNIKTRIMTILPHMLHM